MYELDRKRDQAYFDDYLSIVGLFQKSVHVQIVTHFDVETNSTHDARGKESANVNLSDER